MTPYNVYIADVQGSLTHPYLCNKRAILIIVDALNSLKLRQNGHYFTDDIFNRIFLDENYCIFIQISLEYISLGSNQQYASIGSDNALASTMRQTIIWTNDD